MDFIKTHYTEAPFPLEEFFTFLDISSRIQAEKKFKELINEIPTFSSVNPKLKSFASRIIGDNFIILEQSSMDSYWKNIELIEHKRQLSLDAKLIAAQREKFMVNKNLEFTRSLAESSSRSREHALTIENANNANDLMVKSSNADEKSVAVESSDADDDEDDFIPTPTISLTLKEFRKLVFKCGYWALKDDISLSILRDLNSAIGSLRPQTLGEWLDIFSQQLLNLDLDTTNRDLLKLSLSRIVYVDNEAMYDALDDFFKSKGEDVRKKWTNANEKHVVMKPGLSQDVSEMAEVIIKAVNISPKQARKETCLKRIELLDQDDNNDEAMQILDIFDYILSSLIIKERESDLSELTYYRRFATILEFVLRDTTFETDDGEHCCKATKDVRKWNMEAFDDKDYKQTPMGRRIDLIISSDKMELCSSEWKKENVTKAIIATQQIKNARTNKAILKAIERLPIDQDVYTLGMDWIGSVGYMISVQKYDDTYIVRHIGDLDIPSVTSDIGGFKATLDLLYSWKHQMQYLEKVVEPALRKNKKQRLLSQVRKGTTRARTVSPDTIFSPTKRQKAKNTRGAAPTQEVSND